MRIHSFPIAPAGGKIALSLPRALSRVCLLAGVLALAPGCNHPTTPTPPVEIVTASPLPKASCDATYSVTLSATGGRPPYQWALASGALPIGLTLTPGGVLTGTPTRHGTASFWIQVTDARGGSASRGFDLTVGEPPGVIGEKSYDFGSPLGTSGSVASIDRGVVPGDDFTLECWVKIRSLSALGQLDAILTDDGYGLLLGRSPDGSQSVLRFVVWFPGGYKRMDRVVSPAPQIGVWTHIVAQYAQATGRLTTGMNGSLVSGSTGSPLSLLAGDEPFFLGGNPDYIPASNILKGSIECPRISSGLRYPGNFTPPAREFTMDASTLAMWYLNEPSSPHTDVSCAPELHLRPYQPTFAAGAMQATSRSLVGDRAAKQALVAFDKLQESTP